MHQKRYQLRNQIRYLNKQRSLGQLLFPRGKQRDNCDLNFFKEEEWGAALFESPITMNLKRKN